MSKFLLTLLTVVIAVGVSGGLWVLANVVFNQARYRWRLFNALCFGAIGFILGAILSGNRLTIGSPSEESGGFLTFIWLPLAAMVVLAAIGMVLEQIEEPRQRLMASTIAGLVVGVAIGLLIRARPRHDRRLHRDRHRPRRRDRPAPQAPAAPWRAHRCGHRVPVRWLGWRRPR